MVKSNPAQSTPKKPRTRKQAAAPDGSAAPGLFTGRVTQASAGDKQDQRESVTRRAHRMRMKELFARTNSAT